MNATMTSLPIVPSKFYQVCRLCLTVVSDTNDLLNLSVFGSHNAGCIANTNATNNSTTAVDDCNSTAVNASSNNTNSGSSSSSSNVGVIVKTNRKNSTPTNEHKNTAAASNNASDNEAAAAPADASGRDSANDGKTTITEASRGNNPGDDDNNNFKIDGDLHQSDILERIHTFLSITVSGRIFYFILHLLSQLFYYFQSFSLHIHTHTVHIHVTVWSMCTHCVTFLLKGSKASILNVSARILFISIVITNDWWPYAHQR